MGDYSFDIYFKDLSETAQKEFLEFMGISNPEEGNYDTFPISTVYKGELFGE
jgi:hypothetical protein